MNDMYYNDYFYSDFLSNPYVADYSQNKMCRLSDRDSSLKNYTNDRADGFYSPSEGFSKGNMQSDIYRPYKEINPNLPPVYNEKQRMMMEVQKYGFAMWDLNLYLNTHPTDRNVMMLFDQYRNSYKKAIDLYQSKYGPLSLKDADVNDGYWSWNKCPWPWDGE